jgi:hypothetical protein
MIAIPKRMDDATGLSMLSLFNKIRHEFRALFPVWLFFFLAFSLLRLTQSVIIRQYGFHSSTPSLVLLGSLIVAKTFFFLERFRFVEIFKEKPLIYDVVWKTVIYFVGAFAIYVLEQLLELTIRHHNMTHAWALISTAIATPRFWIIQLWLLMLLFVFTAARETIDAVGRKRLIALWFFDRKSLPATEASPPQKAA